MKPDLHDEEILEEILSRDLSRRDLDRLAQIAEKVSINSELAGRLDELLAVRDRIEAVQGDNENQNAADLAADAAFSRRMADLIDSAATPRASDAPSGGGVGSAGWSPFRSAFLGGAVAAAVAVAAVLGFQGLNRAPGGNQAVGDFGTAADQAQWLPASPGEQSEILMSLAGFYDGRAGWLATTGDDTQIGLTDARIPDDGRPWVSRLSLTTSDGQVLATDLALFAGQNVTISVPRADAPPIRYALRLSGSSSAEDSPRLTVAVSFGAGASLSTVVPIHDGLVQEVGRVSTPRGEYVLHLSLVKSFSGGVI